MRHVVFVLIFALSLSAQAQPPGLPGTATPQPYGKPEVRSITPAPRNSPPLLVNPQRPRTPLSPPQALPKDKPLPQLETQRRSQQQHPAESIGKP
ncbi:hypothetical protein IB232_02525 [Pseudomonas sp. PDM15]|uniref:hypothetical protein n=1 Tax=Pseudomonas sp. PDM15 TaxID=2769303 RepID=UPI00177EEBD7|nr:hypothetical protein [Pseudomonas sp. PDM15]MBD9424190.1 hypothetical protein [Pseudomonas sp. PDM15]